jgi:hypothetical protein
LQGPRDRGGETDWSLDRLKTRERGTRPIATVATESDKEREIGADRQERGGGGWMDGGRERVREKRSGDTGPALSAPSPRRRAAPSSDTEDAEGQEEGLVEAVAHHKSSDNKDVDEQGEEWFGEEENEAHAEDEDAYTCTRHGNVLFIILGSDRSESECEAMRGWGVSKCVVAGLPGTS